MPRPFRPHSSSLQFGRRSSLFRRRTQVVGTCRANGPGPFRRTEPGWWGDMFERTVQVLSGHRNPGVGGTFERTVQATTRYCWRRFGPRGDQLCWAQIDYSMWFADFLVKLWCRCLLKKRAFNQAFHNRHLRCSSIAVGVGRLASWQHPDSHRFLLLFLLLSDALLTDLLAVFVGA